MNVYYTKTTSAEQLKVVFDFISEFTEVEGGSTSVTKREFKEGLVYVVLEDTEDDWYVENKLYPEGDEISLAAMLTKIEEQRDTRVKLNEDYTALINAKDKTVKVGCQTFPIEKVEELVNKARKLMGYEHT